MRYVLIISLIVALFIQCEEPPRVIRPAERYLVDSVYTSMIDSIRIEVDSACARLERFYFDQAVDSIIEVRLKEIEELESD